MPKLTAEGNAILICIRCKGETDKGCPPLPGQKDSTFVCGTCQRSVDRAALASKAPTLVLDGGA